MRLRFAQDSPSACDAVAVLLLWFHWLPSLSALAVVPFPSHLSPLRLPTSWTGSVVFYICPLHLVHLEDNMLPSRPNTGGLPSGPRSRSVGRPPRQPEDSHRRDQTQSRSDAPPRQVRSQRSMASFPSAPTRSRSRPPPMPESRQPNTRAPQSRRYDASVYETQSDAGGSHRSSGASAASSGSSLFDRIKGGGGYASSRTSFDDEEDDQTRKHRDPVDNRGRSLRSRRLAQSEPPSPQGEK